MRVEVSAPEAASKSQQQSAAQRWPWTALRPHWGARLGALWLVATSLAFLAVGVYAWLRSCWWLAVLFLAQGLVCTAYHFCDEDGPELLLGLSKGCPPQAARLLCLCDHGLAHFLFGQMALAVLGPEDPIMQRMDEQLCSSLWTGSVRTVRAFGAPWDVLLLNRIGMSVAMVVFLRTHASWSRFHWDCANLTAGLLLLNCFSFWLLRRESSTSDQVLRLRFWRRVGECLAPQLAGSAALFAFMETEGNARWIHGSWHLLLSMVAILMIRRILQDSGAALAYDDLQTNPVVAHHIFWLAPALALATCLFAFSTKLPSSALSLAALGSGFALTAMWRVLALLPGAEEQASGGRFSEVACLLGVLAAGTGVLALAVEDLPHRAKSISLALLVLLETAAVALASIPAGGLWTLIVPTASTSAARSRIFIVLLLLASELFAAISFLGRNGLNVPIGIASVIGALHAAWPVTWLFSVREELTLCLQRRRMQFYLCNNLPKGGQ